MAEHLFVAHRSSAIYIQYIDTSLQFKCNKFQAI